MDAELRKHRYKVSRTRVGGEANASSKVENGRPKGTEGGLFLDGWLGWKRLPGDGSLVIAVTAVMT